MAFLYYQSGQTIEPGDAVLYHGNPGEVEFVVSGPAADTGLDWYFRANGTGVMIAEPKEFGHVYVTDVADDEDLVFVSRRPGGSQQT